MEKRTLTDLSPGYMTDAGAFQVFYYGTRCRLLIRAHGGSRVIALSVAETGALANVAARDLGVVAEFTRHGVASAQVDLMILVDGSRRTYDLTVSNGVATMVRNRDGAEVGGRVRFDEATSCPAAPIAQYIALSNTAHAEATK